MENLTPRTYDTILKFSEEELQTVMSALGMYDGPFPPGAPLNDADKAHVTLRKKIASELRDNIAGILVEIHEGREIEQWHREAIIGRL